MKNPAPIGFDTQIGSGRTTEPSAKRISTDSAYSLLTYPARRSNAIGVSFGCPSAPAGTRRADQDTLNGTVPSLSQPPDAFVQRRQKPPARVGETQSVCVPPSSLTVATLRVSPGIAPGSMPSGAP